MINIEFIYFFIPIFMGIYVLLSGMNRNRLCILASVILIGWFDVWGLIPLFVSVLTGYLGGIFIYNFRKNKSKQRKIMVCSVMINVVIFILYAHTYMDNTGLMNLMTGGKIPMKFFQTFGTAVYCIHSITYCADILGTKYKCEHSFSVVAAYISFFPCLTAGPILRFDEIADSLRKPEINSEKMAEGIKLFLLGLTENVVLAGSVIEIWKMTNSMDLKAMSAVTAWISMLSFSFGVYYEFAGLSHMAKGLSLMLGHRIQNNFSQPFMSSSILEFTERFNSSLSRWCKDYLYYPLAKRKNKGEEKIVPFHLIIVPFLVGLLWYNYSTGIIIVGAFLSFAIFIENLLRNVLKHIPKVIRTLVVNIIYLLLLSFLAFPNLSRTFGIIGSMFDFDSTSSNIESVYLLRTSVFWLVVCAFFATNIGAFIKKKITAVNDSILTVITPVLEIAMLLLVTSFILSGNCYGVLNI